MFKKAIALLLIILAIYWSFSSLKPQSFSKMDADKSVFSTEHALAHIKEISKLPHYVGSSDHEQVRNYVINQLESIGLEVQVQEGYSYDQKSRNLTKNKNILARIKGSENTKALMLLSHYDSKSHSSLGASDAASGVASILEGLRAYLSIKTIPKNDVIILFSDAEELGLNGAHFFVTEHPWAKDVGLILNFEARGSGGPSYMFIETNKGNHQMVDGFKRAKPEYPAANSLMYSVYKMLPNDTDLTPMREIGDIEGFNFAFIDDHFDYHTALDNYERLDRKTLEHQGSYLMPLLAYFSNADLSNMKSNSDDVYFNVPMLGIVSYPFSWVLPMLVLTLLLFLVLLIYGLRKNSLSGKNIVMGFIPFGLALIINGLFGYFGWAILKSIYPQYNEILQGFPYNGHAYIWAFSFLAIGICFLVYQKFSTPKNTGNLMVAPLFLWLVICAIVALKLKGASFFIIPLIFGLISFWLIIKHKEPYLFLLVFLAGPAIFILSPFVYMFPVGLGLKILVATTVLVTLIFGLLVSVFGYFEKKKQLSYILFLFTLGFFISSHLQSSFNEERPKPNSLVHLTDADSKTAIWATYDHVLDDWSKSKLTNNPDKVTEHGEQTFSSKYHNRFTFTKPAKIMPETLPEVIVETDTVIDEMRHIKLKMALQEHANRVELFSDRTAVFKNFSINDFELKGDSSENVFQNRSDSRILSFYITLEDTLKLDFSVAKNQKTELQIYEASYEIIHNPPFNVPKRSKNMIPKPFVLNDAVITKKTIAFE